MGMLLGRLNVNCLRIYKIFSDVQVYCLECLDAFHQLFTISFCFKSLQVNHTDMSTVRVVVEKLNMIRNN